jgi:hypothetical protein
MTGRAGTVTVIEEPVMRNYARMAKVTFWAVSVITGLVALLALSSIMAPFVAALLGAVIGSVTGLVTAALVIAWPVLRVIWWWLPEITAISGLTAGWIELASHTDLIVRTVVTVAAVGIPAALRPVRRWLIALAWCLASRHRIRTCFSEFIITNRYGTLPLVLGARPTPAGERLWIWLRPGLSLADVQDRSEQVAVACWASSVVIDQAGKANSAILRIDIKRRDPLNGVVISPLREFVAGFVPGHRPEPRVIPTALDLTDVSADDVTPTKEQRIPKTTSPTQWPDKPGGTLTGVVVDKATRPPSATYDYDDISDYI